MSSNLCRCFEWYLSVIDQMAQAKPVWTCSIKGLRWCEVDYPTDLKRAQTMMRAYADEQTQGAHPDLVYPQAKWALG